MSARPKKKRRLRSTMTMDDQDEYYDCDEEEEGYDEDISYFFNNPQFIITESPEIIRLILRGLSLRCLKKCSRVCKIWKFYADKIISERQGVRSFMISKIARNWQSVADIKEVENYFNNLDIDTKFIILFGKLPLSRPCFGGNDLLNLRLLLPPVCPILGCLSSAGIIGTDSSSKTSDFQNPRFDCFSCISFPNIDGLVVRRFHVSLERYQHEFPSKATPLNFETLFGIKPEDRIKCLLLFCPSYYPFELSKEIFSAFYFRERGQIAMAGGVCEDVIEASPEAHEISEFGLTGFAFCGDDRVSAASFVIPAKAKTKKAVQASLEKCTKGGMRLTGNKSFGFIFTCCGRGTRIFKTCGVETNLIKEKFPNTPFAGAFSLGECGVNYWPSTTTNCVKNITSADEEIVAPLPEVLYSYSTTVAVISVD